MLSPPNPHLDVYTQIHGANTQIQYGRIGLHIRSLISGNRLSARSDEGARDALLLETCNLQAASGYFLTVGIIIMISTTAAAPGLLSQPGPLIFGMGPHFLEKGK